MILIAFYCFGVSCGGFLIHFLPGFLGGFGLIRLFVWSSDDERAGESVSIENQKRILEDYARKNGFTKGSGESLNCVRIVIKV